MKDTNLFVFLKLKLLNKIKESDLYLKLIIFKLTMDMLSPVFYLN